MKTSLSRDDNEAKIIYINVMKIKTLTVVILSIFLFLAGCSKSQPELPYLPDNAVILAFGDSLTYGTGAASLNQSYPAILQQLIKREVINGGIPGLTAANAMPELSAQLEQHKPALVILCIGGNDLLRRKGFAEISANIEQLIQFILSKKINVVLIAVPKPGILFSVPNFYPQLAKKYKLFIDTKTIPELEGEREYKADTIHLNAKGYQVLAENIAKLLRESGAIF